MKSHHYIIIAIVVSVVAVAAIGGWWYWRRYYSPAIEPSEQIYPTRGLDLSSHNGKVDFEKVKASGIDFVMLKATEGVSFIDNNFLENYKNAREAGLKVGAYHFFRFDCDGRSQAFHFLAVIRGLELDFPPVFDVEESGNSTVQDTHAVVTSLAQAINHLELHGRDVMLYTNKDGYRRFVAKDFGDYPLWICSFTDPPGPDRWTMWQYTHRGRVDGVSGKVDLNVLSPAYEYKK